MLHRQPRREQPRDPSLMTIGGKKKQQQMEDAVAGFEPTVCRPKASGLVRQLTRVRLQEMLYFPKDVYIPKRCCTFQEMLYVPIDVYVPIDAVRTFRRCGSGSLISPHRTTEERIFLQPVRVTTPQNLKNLSACDSFCDLSFCDCVPCGLEIPSHYAKENPSCA